MKNFIIPLPLPLCQKATIDLTFVKFAYALSKQNKVYVIYSGKVSNAEIESYYNITIGANLVFLPTWRVKYAKPIKLGISQISKLHIAKHIYTLTKQNDWIVYNCQEDMHGYLKWCKRMTNIRLAYEVHSLPKRNIYADYDLLTATTEALSKQISKRVGNSKMVVTLLLPVSLPAMVACDYATSGGIRTLIYMGKLHTDRGFYVVLDALQHLGNRFNLVVFGGIDSEINDAKEYCRKHNITNRIKFHGYLPVKKLADEIVALSGVMVVPPLNVRGYNEIAHTKASDSLAAGRVIVASDLASNREIVPAENWFFQAGDAQGLAEAASQVAATPPAKLNQIAELNQHQARPLTYENRAHRFLAAIRSPKTAKCICLIIDSLGGGGAEKSILSLADTLSKQGHRVDLILFNDVIEYAIDGVDFNVHILKSSPSIAIRTIKRRLMAKVLREKISEFNVPIDLCVSNLPAVDKICKIAKLPNLVFCIRRTISEEIRVRYQGSTGIKKRIRKMKDPYLAKCRYNNANLVTVSKGVENDLLTLGIKPKSVQTIYNPFDANSILTQAKAYNVSEEDYIVHVGRFQLVQKRQDLLIKAYQKSGIKQKLLLVGETDKGYARHAERMRQLVRDLSLGDRVVFVGFKSNPYPYIKNAKALVLSSDFEGLPRVLVEALVLGVPVVSTNCPSGPSEILTGELSQFLSPVGDVNALAENICKVIIAPPQIRREYTDKFSPVVCAKKYLALCS